MLFCLREMLERILQWMITALCRNSIGIFSHGRTIFDSDLCSGKTKDPLYKFYTQPRPNTTCRTGCLGKANKGAKFFFYKYQPGTKTIRRSSSWDVVGRSGERPVLSTVWARVVIYRPVDSHWIELSNESKPVTLEHPEAELCRFLQGVSSATTSPDDCLFNRY